MLISNILRINIFVLGMLFSGASLSFNMSKELKIIAKRMVIVGKNKNSKSDKASYRLTDATITQGKNLIKAHSILVETLNNEILKITANSANSDDLVVFQSQISKDDASKSKYVNAGDMIIAKSEQIIYKWKEQQITLKGKSSLEYPNGSLNSPLIVYDLLKNEVVSDSNNQGQVELFVPGDAIDSTSGAVRATPSSPDTTNDVSSDIPTYNSNKSDTNQNSK